jgi:hypothetical protein
MPWHVALIWLTYVKDSSVGTATGYGLGDFIVRVWFLVRQKLFLLHIIQADSGMHPASYPVGSRGSFPMGKATGA